MEDKQLYVDLEIDVAYFPAADVVADSIDDIPDVTDDGGIWI